MGSIVVCGGGVIGLAAAIMLARDGHQVTALEGDPADVPAMPSEAWESWQRQGVAQFRQPHAVFPRFRQVCDEELPGMTDRLLAAGCLWMDPLLSLPRGISDPEPRPGDEAFRFLAGRRPAIEYAVAGAAQAQPGVVIRLGVRVSELTGGPSATTGIPHLTGVRTAQRGGAARRSGGRCDGQAITRRGAADGAGCARAAGRGPRLRIRVLHAVLHRPVAARRLGRPLVPIGTISLLTIDDDNDTWSVTIFSATRDPPLKALRDAECFTRVVPGVPVAGPLA